MGFGLFGDEAAGQIVGAMGGLSDIMNAYADSQQVDRAYASLAAGNGMPNGIRSRNEHAAYSRYNQLQQGEQAQFNSAVRKETERLVGELQKNSWDFDAIEPPKTLVGISAFGHAADLATKFEAGKEALKQRRQHKIDQTYQEFRKVGGSALNEMANGNFDAAVIDMKRASELAPMPYRLTDFDPRSKTYGIEFRSDKEGGWAQTGRRLTIEQTGNVIKQFLAGEKTMQGGKTYNPVFAGAADRYMEATRRGNAENLKDPSKWITMVNKAGHMIQAVPQNSLDYSQGTHFMVLDEDNGQTTMVDSLDRLSGYVRTTMDLREKKQGLAKGKADIVHTKAQTGKVYADTDKTRASTIKTQAETDQIQAETAGLPDKQAAEKLSQMRKSLGDALKPFHQKGKTLIDFTTGELTDEGNNAFNDAAKLVQSYRSGDWNPANEADKTRLQAAGQAVGIYQQILQQGSAHIPAEDPEQRKQVDEIKTLIKQYGPAAAKRILNKRNDIRTAPTRPGVNESGYGG
ncbi:hypothetical protein [Maridesulfovibrio sp.]|uniref:hypothetical protein n=1 Tax=Maridesulfovibrio sp. TaxID=2795000 RepID=UPI0029C9E5D8|nr:hypothetical protein [Maridesulfovibrio sp.]